LDVAVIAKLVVLTSACGSSGDEKSSPPVAQPVVDEFVAARQDSEQADCICRVARGLFVDHNDCLMLASPAPSATAACLETVAGRSVGAEALLDCSVALEESLASCLSLSGCTELEYNACFTVYSLGFAGCLAVDASLVSELNDCF